MKMWIDIEEDLNWQGNQMDLIKFGLIITNTNNKIFLEKCSNKFEQKSVFNDYISNLIEKYKITEIFHYGSRENTLIKTLNKTVKFTDTQHKIFGYNNQVKMRHLPRYLK